MRASKATGVLLSGLGAIGLVMVLFAIGTTSRTFSRGEQARGLLLPALHSRARAVGDRHTAARSVPSRRASLQALLLATGSHLAVLQRKNARAVELQIENKTNYDWKKYDDMRSDKRAQKDYPNRCGYDYCMNGKIVVPLTDEAGNEYWVEKDGPEDQAARAQKKLKEIEERQNTRSRAKYRSAY
mmetsp:Transcript_12087/g.29726  ORF Transcript_12087/g.29726 Transcript_12087/m.29726 type:complete len:185 (-) Transcript_12087:176-730(-)